MSTIIHSPRVLQGAGGSELTFTRNADTGTSPLITAATAADSDFIWYGPGGTRFTGKQPNIANFPAGDFRLTTRKWNTITALDFSDRKLTAFDPSAVLSKMTALATLIAHTNASWVGNITSWLLPSSMTTFNMYVSTFTLDIGLFVLPPTLADIRFSACANVSGDASLITVPTTLALAYFYSTKMDYGTGGGMATATRNSSVYRFDSCAMAAAEVNRILADCVLSTTTGSTLNVAGTNAAPTGGALNADYVALVAAGWTVTITA